MIGQDLPIRPPQFEDWAAVEAFYPRAFPDEDLLTLLGKLKDAPEAFSLIAEKSGKVIGHIGFAACGLAGQPEKLALLGPLAVDPRFHRQGIGKALIASGFDVCQRAGCARVFVLGDPNYYRRSGFETENDVSPPFDLPQDWQGAWQSFALDVSARPLGRLQVPPLWNDPKLWLP